MRIPFLLSVTCAAILTSCAYEGVIVQKDARPLPFTHTAGVEGSYAFLLRDNSGTVRRQIVTPEVYNQYAVGEYFNDLQPMSARGRDPIDAKVVQTAMNSKPQGAQQIASTRKSTATQRLAAKPATKSSVAKTTAARAKSNGTNKKSPATVAKAKPASTKPAAVVNKPTTVAATAAPIVTKPAPTATVAVATSKPVPAPAPAAKSSAKPALTRPAAKPTSVVAKSRQVPLQKSAPRSQPEPYTPPAPVDPTLGFITVARCR